MQPQEQDLQEPERSTFLLSLLAKRKDAISARIASGIETEWEEDEEHYQGIDARRDDREEGVSRSGSVGNAEADHHGRLRRAESAPAVQ